MTPKVNVTVTERAGRTCASTGSAWEPVIGYSRAVRAGSLIAVTGTVGVEADGTFAPTLKGQTRRALDIILAAVEALGGKATDIIRTRIYVTNIAQWKDVGEVHGEIFGHDPFRFFTFGANMRLSIAFSKLQRLHFRSNCASMLRTNASSPNGRPA